MSRATCRAAVSRFYQAALSIWVINGKIMARQSLLELRPVEKDGATHCHFGIFRCGLVRVEPRARRPFQGWRYLPVEAPPDIDRWSDVGDLPDDLRRELGLLGLL